MQRDDTLSWDRYEVPVEPIDAPTTEVVDLTVVCYEHWVSYPEGMSCPDCDSERALIRLALGAI